MLNRPTLKPDGTTVSSVLLKNIGVDCIIDVGACRGEFAMHMFSTGYHNKIISIEPIFEAFEGMLSNKKRFIKERRIFRKDWSCYKMAIGNHNGKVSINKSHNLVSSSILDDKLCKDISDDTKYVTTEMVKISTLDSFYTKHIKFNGHNEDLFFIKLDTQGYEMNIINGGINTIKNEKMVGMQIECSILELYKDETLWMDIVKFLETLDLVVYDIIPGWRDKHTDRLLQVDIVMLKNNIIDTI